MPNIFLCFMCQQGLAESLKKQSMHFVQIENHNSSDLDCFIKLETFLQKYSRCLMMYEVFGIYTDQIMLRSAEKT